MRSRYRVVEPQAAQFITSTVVGWLPLFTTAARCQIIVDAFACCREHKGLKIHGWVIVDNHLHAVLTAPDLPRVMADFCCGRGAPATRRNRSFSSGRKAIIRRPCSATR